MSGDVTPLSEEALAQAPSGGPLNDFSARCDAIEEAYEFMLAYAAQGLPNETGSVSGSQIRDFLKKCDAALTGLAEALTSCVQHLDAQSAAPYHAFISVVGQDAARAQAAVQLVLAQPSIGSQLVDNLNASIHVRALLTDLFLLDAVLKSQA